MPDNELELSPEVLTTLLSDHTTGRIIFWATHDYESLGTQYDFYAEIQPELISGKNSMVVRPRVLKSKENQTDRSRDMAEVFTPSWICRAQNNLVDDALPKDMKWEDYVQLTCMEITCGEAPYLASRYDTTTGEPIPIGQRIGLLDRKLRVVSENVQTRSEWLHWAAIAYQNIYGYEWQGDSLFLARLSLLHTFIEYYQAKFNDQPLQSDVLHIADIISWNLWQMDGLTYGIPGYEPTEQLEQDLFSDFFLPKPQERFCRIFDWEKREEVIYANLINKAI